MHHVSYVEKIRAERALNIGALTAQSAAVAAVLNERLDEQTAEACDTSDELANWKNAAATARGQVIDAEKELRELRARLLSIGDVLQSGQRVNKAALAERVDLAIDSLDMVSGRLDEASAELAP